MVKKKERKSSFSSTLVNQPTPRKSSLSTSPHKGLRVSWASSAAIVDVDGHTSQKSKAAKATRNLSNSPFDRTSVVDAPAPIPKARSSIPRLSTSIEARAPRGEEMIAAKTPDVCEGWSKMPTLSPLVGVGIQWIHSIPRGTSAMYIIHK